MIRYDSERKARTYKLYRSLSEDQSVRYWILEERNRDYYYLVTSGDDFPPATNWITYGRGVTPCPTVSTIPEMVETELRTRIENQDTLSTLDLSNEYQAYNCTTNELKRAYMAIWAEQPRPAPRRLSKDELRKQ